MATEAPFSTVKARYDTKTFSGRLSRNLDMVDPSTLFLSSEKIEKAKITITELKALEKSTDDAGFKALLKNDPKFNKYTNAELWDMRKTVEAIFHPDTGEAIFMPFRMSGYVPFGTPIVVGMVLPNPTTASMIFWQWLNQTHNACVNFSNANASKPVDKMVLAQGYFAACSGACAVSVGMSKVVSRMDGKFSPGLTTGLKLIVPFCSVAVANILNVTLMRRNELETGIDVFDHEGKSLGSSVKAAQKAVFETAVSRVILPAPILLFPPFILAGMEKMGLYKKGGIGSLVANAVVCTVAFGGALPVALSLFPQDATMKATEVEESLTAGKVDSFGKPILDVFFNKGL